MERHEISVDLAGHLGLAGTNNAAVIQIDLRDGVWTLRAAQRGLSDAIPASEYYEIDRTYELCRTDFVTLNDNDAKGILDSLGKALLPLLERIRNGHSVEWDVNRHVGHLTPDALTAHDNLQALIEHTDVDLPETWFFGDWIGMEEIGDSTATELMEQAAADGIRIWGGVAKIQETIDCMQAQ